MAIGFTKNEENEVNKNVEIVTVDNFENNKIIIAQLAYEAGASGKSLTPLELALIEQNGYLMEEIETFKKASNVTGFTLDDA